MYYVYELINLVGTVEYVGMTKNAKRRMVSHKCKNGLFHKRQDIFMNIVKEFNDTKSCFRYETEVKLYHGLVPSEHLTRRMNGINNSAKAVIITNIKTGEVKEFYGLQNDCQNMGLNTGEAGRVARGGKLHHKGYYIKYK